MDKYKEEKEEIKILFICLGNICRSPAANAIMQHLVENEHVAHRFYIDSAGMGNWHVGDLPDRRMREHGAKRNYKIDHIARQFNRNIDFENFDYIVAMDEENYADVCSHAKSVEERNKVLKMCNFFQQYKGQTAVPDPYYGDAKAFDFALDLIEDGCKGLYNSLKKKHNL